MKVQKRRRVSRSAFTLIEVLLVVGILVALMAMVAPNLIGSQEKANIGLAKVAVKKVEEACTQYKILYSNWPSSGSGIQDLMTGGSSPPPDFKPILRNAEDAKDPWGRPINYQFPGQHNGGDHPDVWSNGPDGVSGTADDIGNWTTPTR